MTLTLTLIHSRAARGVAGCATTVRGDAIESWKRVLIDLQRYLLRQQKRSSRVPPSAQNNNFSGKWKVSC
jgi:hypothetical protein